MTDIETPGPDTEAYIQREAKPEHAYLDGPRSVLGLYRWFRIGYITYIAAAVLYLLVAALILLPLARGANFQNWSPEALTIIGSVMTVVPIGFLIVYIFCVVMTCRVTYRSMRNLHTIGSNQVSNSPTMAVVYYFIPFANLVMPAQVTSDIYRGTMRATDGVIKEGRISLWWASWLISNFSERIAGVLDFGLTAAILSIASLIFSIAAAYALMRIFRDIAKAQEDLKHGGVAAVFD